MERKPFPSPYEGDPRQDDKRRRLFGRINPVTKEAVSGWFNTSETPPKAPPEPEQRMPVSIVAPEGGDTLSRTISHEAAMHGSWLGDEVRPPEKQTESPEQESVHATFQEMLEEAGLEELSDSFKQKKGETESRNQARARRLIAYGAGLLVGSHLGVERVRPELAQVVREIKERQAAENPFELKSEEHVVQDAWHKVVIDRYGREDLGAREQYGLAFQQEQKEILQSALSDNTPQGSAQAQQPVADDMQAQQSQPPAQPQPQIPPTPPASPVRPTIAPTSPSPMINGPVPAPRLSAPSQANEPALPAGLTQPMLRTGRPIQKDPQHLLPANFKTGFSVILNPWVWFVVGLLLLVFFAVSLFG